jgi:hypothetical protein
MYIRLRYLGTLSVLRDIYCQIQSKFCILGCNLGIYSGSVLLVTPSLAYESVLLHENESEDIHTKWPDRRYQPVNGSQELTSYGDFLLASGLYQLTPLESTTTSLLHL